MYGELAKESVIIKDQKLGSQLYNKGNYGYPLSGGGLELDLIEATYLVEAKRLVVKNKKEDVDFKFLFTYSSKIFKEFDVKYAVYRDIRERGFVIKLFPEKFDMAIYPRGKTPSNSSPEFYLCSVSERSSSEFNSFKEILNDSSNFGKRLLYGVVDEEGDITYYEMFRKDPDGKILNKIDGSISGILLHDKVFVFDESEYQILRKSFYGKAMVNGLQLSLVEAYYLMKMGCLNVFSLDNKMIDIKEFFKFAEDSQEEFGLRSQTYEDMRNKGLVVKSGFKYGTHFRAYEKSPDDIHAKYLVHALSEDNVGKWPEISRAVRLAGGVKKDILFCIVSDTIEYVEFKWFRP